MVPGGLKPQRGVNNPAVAIVGGRMTDTEHREAEFREVLTMAESIRAFADMMKRRYPARAHEIETDAVAAMGAAWRMIGRDG